MKINRNIVGMAAIAAVAFTVGRLGLPLGGQSTAIAQDPGEMEMTPAMEAWMKAATPGKHHKYLEALIGDFTADVKIWESPDAEPMQFTRQTDGITRELPRWVLVAHQLNHQTHHRGQLTTLLSLLGLDDDELRYLHAGRLRQLTDIGGHVLDDLIA